MPESARKFWKSWPHPAWVGRRSWLAGITLEEADALDRNAEAALEAYASSRVAALEQRIADAIGQLEWISSGGTCDCDDHKSEDCCVVVGERCVTCESEVALARLREVKHG